MGLHAQRPYQTNLLIAGWDKKDGPSLYWMDYLATMHHMNVGGTGYGESRLSLSAATGNWDVVMTRLDDWLVHGFGWMPRLALGLSLSSGSICNSVGSDGCIQMVYCQKNFLPV